MVQGRACLAVCGFVCGWPVRACESVCEACLLKACVCVLAQPCRCVGPVCFGGVCLCVCVDLYDMLYIGWPVYRV